MRIFVTEGTFFHVKNTMIKKEGEIPMGSKYEKGKMSTFPLELMEVKEDCQFDGSKYLYPREVAPIQACIEEYCDQMEYDGSFMYDEYPDKVRFETLVRNICKEKACENQENLVQVMLCQEMAYRRQRRKNHKDFCYSHSNSAW